MKIRLKKPGKKTAVAVVAAVGVIVAVIIFLIAGGEKEVSFETVSGKDIPREIESQVIPEYKDLERALACLADDRVYVVVTRGEKTTSGYGVTIEKMKLKDGVLVVYAMYSDPKEGDAVSQVLTYPYSVGVTSLKKLPQSVELKVMYR